MNRHLFPWLLLLAAFALLGCSGDESSGSDCSEGKVLCGDFCTDLLSSTSNCGQCGKICASGQSCVNGACAITLACASGQTDCGGVCVNTLTDGNNCGTCGNPCGSGLTCRSGSCQSASACLVGLTACATGCADTLTDPNNCGACGTMCGAGTACQGGACAATSTSCTAPQVDCSGICADMTVDRNNCGSCGRVCTAEQTCNNGLCCSAGQTNCGFCTDLLTDRINCGSCDTACQATDLCVNGVCTPAPTCSASETICAGVCVAMTSDNNNCGACGTVCGAGLLCQAGLCAAPPTCTAEQNLCNAVCTNLAVDNNNCGACSNVCSGGLSCISGTCTTGTTLTCTAPQLDCGGTVCVDGSTDNANCGTCGTACSGGATCQGGACLCPAGQEDCNADGTCDNLQTSNAFCGACTVACTTGQGCEAGLCVCDAGTEDCGADGTCENLAADPANCGACGTVCGESEVCSLGACTSSCAEGLENCSGSCVSLGTDSNCSACGDICDAATNETCVAGACTVSTTLVCTAPELDCGGETCVDGSSDNANCGECENACEGGTSCVDGACECPAGQEMCGTACVDAGTCDTCATVSAGMISNFENQSLTVIDQAGENWDGTWETFQEATQGPPLTIESTTPPPDSCGTYALHTQGSDYGGWVGVDVTLRGTDHNAATEYDASDWTGIRFWAKGAANNTPVRFNVSTAWTEGSGSGGECVDTGSGNDWEECYNHVGKFLYDLGTEWKQYTLCFDRDLYPLFVPGYLDAEQRKAVASRILKFQWQFNNAKDLSTLDPTNVDNQGEFPKYAANSEFELWLDDVELFDGACPEPDYSRFTGNKPFPQNNTAFGNCDTVENASTYSAAVLRAYETWIENLVTTEGSGSRVMSPEHDGTPWGTPSEAMGYGMMITAAMGDKALFDRFWTYTQDQIIDGVGLMLWLPGNSGSATDADADIAFSLLMAEEQWGGGTYASAASAMIDAMYREDVTNGNVNVGSNDWISNGFNASYFTPSFYPAYGGSWSTIRDNGYTVLAANQTSFGNGLFSDWCSLDGTPIDGNSVGANVTGGFSGPVYGYDAARVPWRLGMDACANGEDRAVSILSPLLAFFAGYSTYESGDRIDLLVAGWQNGAPANDAVANQMSFIGPVGVGAMAVSSRANMREMAFRAVLDILENPEYNQTYYPTTLGLITALTMSGNLVHP